VSEPIRTAVRKYESPEHSFLRELEDRARQRCSAIDPQSAVVEFDEIQADLLADAARDAAAENALFGADRSALSTAEAYYRDRVDEYSKQRRALERERDDRLADIEKAVGASSRSYQAADHRQREAQRRYDEATVRVRFRDLRIWGAPAYPYVMVTFALAEAPFNRLSFELVFEDSQWVSWLFALACGAALVLLSHFGGAALRRVDFSGGRVAAPTCRLGATLLILTFAAAMLYVIAVLRQSYIHQRSETDPPLAGALLADMATRASESTFTTVLDAVGALFLAVNGVLFAVGMTYSVVRHDPDPDYERTTNELARANAAVQALHALIDRRASALRMHFENLCRPLDALIERNEGLRNARSTALAELETRYRRERLRLIASGAHQFISISRSAYHNELKRRGVNVAAIPISSPEEIYEALALAVFGADALTRLDLPRRRLPSPANELRDVVPFQIRGDK
jgi:hypothetical protein